MKKFLSSKVFMAMAYTLLFFLLILNSQSYLDPDLGWHLRVGQDILASGAVPHLDQYSQIAENISWTDHEWLFNVFIYWFYENFGYFLLEVLFSLFIIITFAILHYLINLNSHHRNNRFFIFFWLFLGFWGSCTSWGVRMQEITALFLAVELAILASYEKKRQAKTLLWLVPFFALWANLHGSFLIGLFTFALFVAYLNLAPFFGKYNFSGIFQLPEKLTSPDRFLTFILLPLSWGATLLNPYGFKLYGFLTAWGNSFYLTKISEWLPAWNYPYVFGQVLFLALAVTVVSLALLSRKTIRVRPINAFYFTLSLIFFFLALKSRRHFPLFFVSSLPFLVPLSVALFNINGQVFARLPLWRYIKLTSFALAVVLLAFMANAIKPANDPFVRYDHFYPGDAVAFLKSRPEYWDKKMFNTYGWGGYLIWVWPEKPVFTDGRFPQILRDGRTLLEEYYDFYDQDKMAGQLDKHGIELVLISRPKPLELKWWGKYLYNFQERDKEPVGQALANHLDLSDNWRLVYRDETSLAYAKE